MVLRKALILGGTGMLAGVAEALTGDGWLVVLPSRRYSPVGRRPPEPGIAARMSMGARGHRPQGGTATLGRAIWVEAQWERPRELAAKAEAALGGPADLLVAWVHDSYRRAVMGVVEPLLRPEAPVVEVREAASVRAGEPESVLVAHPTQQVRLGAISEQTGRPLNHAETAAGVLEAVSRALEGKPTLVHQIGHNRPYVR
ncbi:Rossmann-fold NAD(P)-binding domain-containing protein [Amycolatopsis magusensis]|uniref:Short chain dehydrogenase n=1 Tax=Amycolatopsis magusensis TaxID=882444 RepID=A0ABS4PS67_9PSEU|nr:hypothetical protein [Amycolatopsis magusensis]MBP2182262.1 hypothetical protein [Amycolatopsis magusensis]MDI5974657.1 hypothetical protein [Amycolatopsis magusensis]